MTTKSARSHFARKLPIALFVVAAAVLIQGLVARGLPAADGSGLPNPTDMALLSTGRIGTPNVVELWQERVADVPASPIFRTRLADSMLTLAGETGDLALYSEAEGVARSAIAIDPTNEPANLTLASALAGQHDFAGALALAQAVLDTTPQSISARIAAGDAHLDLGDYAAAAAVYDGLAAELPGTPSILSRQARLASLTGRLDEAIELATQALIGAGQEDLDTYTGSFYWFQVAFYQHQDGRYDDADQSLTAALQVEPRHLGATELRGKVLTAQGRYDEATELYEELLQRTEAADLRGELAKLYEQAGRAGDAAEQIELGLELARATVADYPAERRHLISFLSDLDPALAVELARQDLEQRQDVHSYAWLAWTLLQDGRPDEAVTHVDEALRLGTQDAWLLYQVGSVYAAVGESEKARALLTDALELNPEFDLVHAERARMLLAELAASA